MSNRNDQLVKKPGNQRVSADHSGPISSSESWGLRYPGLVMGAHGRPVRDSRLGGENAVIEFNGMWGLKPDARPEEIIAKATEPWFLPTTAKLALIRSARWFIIKSGYFPGYTLVFSSHFDGTLAKYFDDFTLNGKENLLKVWGQCVGCPDGPDATAHDIVEFIARGQFKTLIAYDAFPELSHNQIHKNADWYKKTQKFQRAVSAGGGNLEDKVDAFFSDLAKPYELVPNDAVADPDVTREWQYEDIAERVMSKA